MDFDSLKTATVAFVQEHQAWAPFIAGGLAFGESLAFLSLLFPATVLLVAIGSLVGATGLDFWTICLGATLGAALGDWLSYEIGLRFEDRVFQIWPLSRHPEMVDRGRSFFQRWGAWSVVLGRFFGPLRAVVPLIAGIFGMNRALFQLANFPSALAWAFMLLKFGDVAGEIVTYLLRLFQT